MLNFKGCRCWMSWRRHKVYRLCNSFGVCHFILTCSTRNWLDVQRSQSQGALFLGYLIQPFQNCESKDFHKREIPTFTGWFCQEYIQLYFLHGGGAIFQPSNYIPRKTRERPRCNVHSLPRKRCAATTRKWFKHSWKTCTTDAHLQTVFLWLVFLVVFAKGRVRPMAERIFVDT